jgi:hypothetical protein
MVLNATLSNISVITWLFIIYMNKTSFERPPVLKNHVIAGRSGDLSSIG